MLLFLWTNDDMDGAVASDNIEPVTHVNWDGSVSASDLADAAYDDMAARDDGRRCLFFRHFADGERTGHTQVGDTSVEDWFANRRGRLDEIRSEQFEFWETWRAKGDVRPNFWTFDEEDAIGITTPGGFTEASWALRAAKIAKVNNHPFLKRYSPEQLRAYTQANIAAFSSWDSGVGRALMWWAHNNIQIFLDSIKDAIGAYSTVLGEAPPPTNNYGDEILNRTRYGLQSEPYFYGERSIGGMNAPYLYLNRFSPSLPPIFTGQTSAHRWLMFLYNQNWMRQCRRTATLMPWFSYPSWDGLTNTGNMTSSRYMIRSAAAMGVTHGTLWSSPAGMGSGGVPSLSTQLAHVQATLDDLPSREVEDTDVLPLFDYDDTTVTIGDWSVTYSAGDWGTS